MTANMRGADGRLNRAYSGVPTFLRSDYCDDIAAMDADYAVLGVPYDDGSPFMGGSRFCARAVREHSLRFGGGALYDIAEDKEYLREAMANRRIVDCGDVDVAPSRGDITMANLTNDVIASDHLKAWINAAEGNERPVVFCVSLPDDTGPKARHAMPQRRIDLLAYEQNAWVLGSRDDRCVVVSTRTELDWGMRNDQIMVWAPSKMVVDAVDGPTSAVHDAMALFAWFGSEIQAVDMVVVGGNVDAGDVRSAPVDQVAL